jgi:hypothetical protein
VFCHVLSLPSARLGACNLTHSRLIGRVRESDLPQPHVCTPAFVAKVSRSAPSKSRIRPLCVSPVFASAWFFAGGSLQTSVCAPCFAGEGAQLVHGAIVTFTIGCPPVAQADVCGRSPRERLTGKLSPDTESFLVTRNTGGIQRAAVTLSDRVVAPVMRGSRKNPWFPRVPPPCARLCTTTAPGAVDDLRSCKRWSTNLRRAKPGSGADG